MNKFLKSIDINGKEFSFNIDGESTYRTIPGAIFSIFTYIAFLLLTWYFGQDIYQKESPSILVQTGYLNDYPSDISNISNNFMALGMKAHSTKSGTNVPIIDPRILIPIIHYTDISFDSSGSSHINALTSDLMKNCSTYNLDPNIYNIMNSYCFDYNNTFGGNSDTTYLKLFTQTFAKCSNLNTLNLTCSTEKEINDLYNYFVLTP